MRFSGYILPLDWDTVLKVYNSFASQVVHVDSETCTLPGTVFKLPLWVPLSSITVLAAELASKSAATRLARVTVTVGTQSQWLPPTFVLLVLWAAGVIPLDPTSTWRTPCSSALPRRLQASFQWITEGNFTLTSQLRQVCLPWGGNNMKLQPRSRTIDC